MLFEKPLFCIFSTREQFEEAAKTGVYANSLVVIKNSQEIWAKGVYIGVPEVFKTKLLQLESDIENLQLTDTQINSKVDELVETLKNYARLDEVDEKLSALKKEILTGGEDETIDEAYDTLLEIAKWIEEHGDSVELVNRLAAVETKLAELDGSKIRLSKYSQEVVDFNTYQRDYQPMATSTIDDAVSGLGTGILAVKKYFEDLLTWEDNTED